MPTVASKKRNSSRPASAKNPQRLSISSGKNDREVIYPKLRTTIHSGSKPIDVAMAKKLLGWEEEPEDEDDWGNDFLLRVDGRKVRCTNNLRNRPLYRANVEAIKQDILRNQWRLNGETLIVGKTGTVLNGQHTLVALVLASLAYEEHPDIYEDLEAAPTLSKIVVYGVSEDDDVVNTLDTCKPRRLTDILFRSAVFQEMPKPIQKKAAGLAASSSDDIWRELWKKSDLVGGRERPTIPEKVEFLSCHPRLIECVLFVLEADGSEDLLKRFFPRLQVVVRLVYLMSNTEADPTKYYEAFPVGEDRLDFAHFEKAKEFFLKIARGDKSVRGLVDARRALGEDLQAPVQLGEMVAMTIAAWHQWLESGKCTQDKIYPEMEKIDGMMQLKESPLIGGIHMGDDGYLPTDPTESEVEKRKEKLRSGKGGRSPKSAKAVTPQKAGKEWAPRDVAWIPGKEESEEWFIARISSIYPGPKGSQYAVVEDNHGDLSEHNTNELHLEKQ